MAVAEREMKWKTGFFFLNKGALLVRKGNRADSMGTNYCSYPMEVLLTYWLIIRLFHTKIICKLPSCLPISFLIKE
jgi:hypothetical protein